MTLGIHCIRCLKHSPPPPGGYAGDSFCLHDPAAPVSVQDRLKARFCPLGRFPASDEEIAVRQEDDRRTGPCCAPPAVE